jgi:protein-S-isoprenylcysteine O-methyltransferase Ste14
VGAIFYLPGTAVVLGSLRALLPAALILAGLIVRTWLEDETLRKELPGYADYSAKVRYRLVPGLW